MKFLILNGPNLNFLGIREPEIYGKSTYEDLVHMVEDKAKELSVEVIFRQSNHEGDLVDTIQEAYYDGVSGIVFNPAAYTHTSIAIADAVKAVGIPTVEVHISAVEKREAFRQVSYIRDIAVCTITGEGLVGYCKALDFLVKKIKNFEVGAHENNG